MNSLEVLLNAEQTLLDPNEPYNHNSWNHCTCGHIYHGVTGVYNYRESKFFEVSAQYEDIFDDIVKALGLREGMLEEYGDQEYMDHSNSFDLLSDYTEMIAKNEDDGNPDGWAVYRYHALGVIQEAIAKIRERDSAAMLKIIDPHTYEVV